MSPIRHFGLTSLLKAGVALLTVYTSLFRLICSKVGFALLKVHINLFTLTSSKVDFSFLKVHTGLFGLTSFALHMVRTIFVEFTSSEEAGFALLQVHLG